MNTKPTGATLSREPETLYTLDAKALSRYLGADLIETGKHRTHPRPTTSPSFVVTLDGTEYDAVVVESLVTDETKPELQEPLAIVAISLDGLNDTVTEWYTLVTYEKRDPNVTLAPRIVRANSDNFGWLKENLDLFQSAE